MKKPALLIVNTDPSTLPGKHWVAFFIPKRGPVEYFDSIGRKPDEKFFIEFLKKHGKSFIYNKKRLQGYFSTTCGNYCGVYLYFKSKGLSFRKFLDLFADNDFQKNDVKILDLYKKIFGQKKKAQIGGNCIICNQTCQPCEV